MSKKILYLSYFFEPDLGAGSFRNTALAKKLSELLKDGDSIELITTTPNRYADRQLEVPNSETIGKISLHRIKVERLSNSFLHQIFSFLQYRKGVNYIVQDNSYDLVFASSSKLFTAYLAYRIARKKSSKLYLDLRDLFAVNLKELFPRFGIGYLMSFLIKIFFEKPCVQYAHHLNLNSEGFKEEFKYKDQSKISYYPNGIDDYFIGYTRDPNLPSEPIVITYAGNIGEGQGLHKIVPELAKKLGNNYLFQIIGDGSAKYKLQRSIQNQGISNVILMNSVSRDKLLAYYLHTHYLFLHLNNFKSFEKVIPSKIFEYGAFDMPILAGVSGFPAQFIRKEIRLNCLTFEPCNVEEIYDKIRSNIYHLTSRDEFVQKYKRENIVQKMAISIISYLS